MKSDTREVGRRNVSTALEDIRFRILVPVWGRKYIDGFCDIALPALLAEGNLPALIDRADCEVIFLTTTSSVEFFNNSAGVANLKSICPCSFVYIDDLLPIVEYGIILTTAYGRGVASLGDRQLSTYFVFLNADFVLSNGTLRSVVDRIDRGFNAVMAPSLRSVEQNVEDELKARVSPTTGRLEATPAELVQLTLDNLHPTATASIINRPAVHHTGANQFFWQVDDHTLIGRYFLLFMLCIRPEQMFGVPTGWCDYAFVPDLVPSGNFHVLTDSDDGFILEMQALRGDGHHVRIGPVSPEYYRPRLAFWTTENHRLYASSTIIFHSRDLPPNFESVKSEADKFMDTLLSGFKTPAVPHRNHPFWVSAVRHHQKRLGLQAMPREFATEITVIPMQFKAENHLRHLETLNRIFNLLAKPVVRSCKYVARRVKKDLIGKSPTVGPLHYAFMDFSNFRHQIQKFGAANDRVLYVKDHGSPVDHYVRSLTSPDEIMAETLLSAREETNRFTSAKAVIISLSAENIEKLPDILIAVGRRVVTRTTVLLCVSGVQGAFFHGQYSLAGDLAREIASKLQGKITVSDYFMVGNKERLSIDYRVRKSFQLLLAKGFIVRIAVTLVVFSSLLKLFYINMTQGPRSAIPEDDVCTSATVRFEIHCYAKSASRSDDGVVSGDAFG